MTFFPPAGANFILIAPGTTATSLQQMVNTVAPNSVLQLQAGHHTFDRTITIARDDVSVIGVGSDRTFVHVPASLGKEAFKLGDGRMTGDFRLAATLSEGGTELTLTGAHSLVAGDYIHLARDSTEAFYDQIGDDVWRNTDVPLRTSIIQVAQVSGNKITLASGVHFDFVPGETRVREIAMAEGVALGGFSVDYGLGQADPSLFRNTLSAYDRNAVIEVGGTAGLSLFDITARNVPSLGVNVALSSGVAAQGITISGAHNKGDGGNGYALQIRDVYDSSFTGMSDQDMRHSVVFASWRSAAGNQVHVAQTDRDINFHGGRDHDNVVMVDRSIRDANSDVISPTLFVNTQGTHYGSVTDAGANTVRFGQVIGTRLNDAVTGYDTGAWLDGAGGHDSLTGGAGNDLLRGGAGRDVIKGGGGTDIAAYSGKMSGFAITPTGPGILEVRDRVGDQSTDSVSGVEWLLFDDGALRVSDMAFLPVSAVAGIFAGPGSFAAPPAAPPPQTTITGTAGKDVFEVTVKDTRVLGLDNWDVVNATVDFVMSDDVERLNLTGTAAIDGTGGANANHIHGNDAANTIAGLAGNDRLWGEGGDDVLLGGAGDDQIYGDAGNDRINGGAGQDRLTGGAGADVFVFSLAEETARTKSDKVLDFQSGLDRIDLSAIDANTLMAGDQAFVWAARGAGPGALWHASGYLFGDTDGNGVADLAIYLGGATVVPSDILF